MDSILITGGAGFIGSHAAARYATAGVDVTVLDNLSRGATLADADQQQNTARYNWRWLRDEHPSVDRVEGDVRHAETVRPLVADHDAVLHAAGQVAVTASLDAPAHDLDVNAGGTLTVLEAARQTDHTPPVVLCSTNKVYGEHVTAIPVRERDTRYQFADPEYADGIPESLPVDGGAHTPYGVSKLAADLYVQDYAARTDVPATALRLSCVYGPRQFGCEDQGWVAHFVRRALQTDPLTIYGDGKQVRDLLYIDDLLRAIDAVFASPTDAPAVCNIGGGPEHTTSLLELLDTLAATTGTRPAVTYDDWRDGDQRVYISDISRAQETLDWSPRVAVETGVERLCEWARSALPADESPAITQ